jgi:pilus assembly protein CpaE
MTAIVDANTAAAEMLQAALGPETTVLTSLEALRHHLNANPGDDVVVLSSAVDLYSALALAESLRVTRPSLGVILVRRRVDTSVLQDALRAGVREVVDERDLHAVTAAVRRARALGRAMREQSNGGAEDGRRHGRIVTVFSAKGGCGKTTLATNLGVALADRGNRDVCIVDLDLAFGDVAVALGLRPVRTIADAVPLADTIDGPTLASLLTAHSPGVKMLAAPLEPGLAESVPTDLVSRVLLLLREQFDYVVVDTPPAFTDHVLAIFDQTDVLALIATLDIPALKNLNLTLHTLQLLNYPRERWRVVINRSDSKVGLLLSEVEDSLRFPLAGRIPSSRDVPTSINRGKPIVLENAKHPVSASIFTFADRHVAPPSSVNGSKGPDKRRRRIRRKEPPTS